MTTIDRYIMREVGRYFVLILVAVTMIYVIADFFERIDNLIEAEVSLAQAVLLILSRIPLEHLIPASILLAVLVVFGLMVKHNELIALKTGGVSLHRCIKAPLLVGVGTALFLFLCAELVLPLVRSAANRQQLAADKQLQINPRDQNVWLRGERFIVHIRHFNAEMPAAFGVTLNFFDARFRLIRRVEAERIQLGESKWTCHAVLEQVLHPTQGDITVRSHERMDMPAYFPLADLKSGIRTSSEMGVFELGAYIRTVAAEGYDTIALQVDWQAKVAFPLVCILLPVMAAAIAGRARRRQGIAGVVVAGLGLAFCFWVIQSFSLALGYAAVLPPLLAAWIPILIYAATTAIALLRAE
ncbi:MAG: LPS export ABC transporter permease LptG [Desulfobacterales bacterium]|nr:LPS export ABC transporter permease LptG [Desulfobacterales bacterium]